MSKARRNGSNLWYQVHGDTGSFLTLIGGFALVDDQFEFCNQYLMPHHRLLHWHYRGVGKSDWSLSEPYSVEGWVDDLVCILDHAGIEKTSIWCTSTGTSIGVRFASKYPERVDALITYPWIRSDRTWKDIFLASYHVGSVFGVDQLSRMYAGVVLPTDLLYSPEGIEYEKWAKEKYIQNINPTTLENVLNAYSNLDLSSDIQNLDCPTMLLMGNDSALNSDSNLTSASYEGLLSDFMELKDDLDVVTIEDAGSTYCMITKPEECSMAVVNYLKKQDIK
jgi:pimeloyl-ACP methyl ester carboxylesterase